MSALPIAAAAPQPAEGPPAEVLPLVTRTEQSRVDAHLAAMPAVDVVHYELEGCIELSEIPFASADRECVHGRLAGDRCPSPRVKFTSGLFTGRVEQNWPHDHPCGCWPTEATP